MNKNKGGEIEDQEDKIYLLNSIQDNMLDNTILKGVKGVSKVNMRMVKGYEEGIWFILKQRHLGIGYYGL